MFGLFTAFRKWRASRGAAHRSMCCSRWQAGAPYAERSEWLIELAHWIRRHGTVQADAATDGAATRSAREHVRLRYLLNVLDRNPAWKANVASILRAVLRESDGISLLCDAGMPVHSGFLGALVERIQGALIPPAPNRRELGVLFSLMFTSPRRCRLDRDPAGRRAGTASARCSTMTRPTSRGAPAPSRWTCWRRCTT